MNTYVPAATIEEDFVNLVRLELNDIKNSFFKIGFRLREANNCKYYLKLGFQSIEDCAETLFGFGKTTTYDLMRIASLFGSKEAPMHIDEHYEGYSQSQLVLFSQVNYNQQHFITMASPSDSISTIKKAKSYWNMIQKGKLNSFPGWRQCKNFAELINRVEAANSQLLPTTNTPAESSAQVIAEENSGHPEKPKENAFEATEKEAAPEVEISEWDKRISDHLVPACIKMLTRMSYKTIFDHENKGIGPKVPPETVSRQMVRTMLEAFDSNRTVIKTKFRNYIAGELGKYNYEIHLCGKKQSLTQFCGNIATFIMDLFFEELNVMLPERLKKKRK